MCRSGLSKILWNSDLATDGMKRLRALLMAAVKRHNCCCIGRDCRPSVSPWTTMAGDGPPFTWRWWLTGGGSERAREGSGPERWERQDVPCAYLSRDRPTPPGFPRSTLTVLLSSLPAPPQSPSSPASTSTHHPWLVLKGDRKTCVRNFLRLVLGVKFHITEYYWRGSGLYEELSASGLKSEFPRG